MSYFSLGFNPIEQIAQKGVRQSMAGIAQSMTRLSTGKRINSAKDDPAGLIAAEYLKSENVEAKANLKATKELGNKLATTDSHLSQISDLLTDIKGAILEGANTGAISDSELDSLQMQIDYALDAIQRITRTADYKGEKLLDGLFSVLDGFSGLPGSGAEENATTVSTAVLADGSDCSTCMPTASRTIQTDALANLTSFLFSGDSEEENGMVGVSALLQRIVKAVDDVAALEISDGETAEGEDTENPDVKEGLPDSESDSAKSQAEAEVLAQTSFLEEAALPKESPASAEAAPEEEDPYETFFEMERQLESESEPDSELDSGPESEPDAELDAETDVVDEADVAETEMIEEEADAAPASEEEPAEEDIEKEEFDPASTFLYGKPGDYWFRELDEFDYLNREEPEEETVSAASIVSELSTGSKQISFLENLVALRSASPLSIAPRPVGEPEGGPDTLDESDDENGAKNTLEESKDSLESETEGGRLFDLCSGGSASLRNDPEKADRIIDGAIRSIGLMRARVGAEQKYSVDANITMLEDQILANTTAYSQLSDADFAEEMSNLVRCQILLQSNLKILEMSRQIPRMMLDMLDAGFSAGMARGSHST